MTALPDFLNSFEQWLEHQKLPGPLTAEIETLLRRQYEAAVSRASAHDPDLWMRKPPQPGEYRYAVVIDDGADQWVTLCVKRSPKGEYFVLIPRDGEWDPHASYHFNGQYHQKSYGMKSM
ncbi:MAG TPA: hypothetical protein VFO44_15140, partial [Steroidobacteraceae bacterium]|nr:hypothetical protein [Steroidobacteraceae bacterium]